MNKFVNKVSSKISKLLNEQLQHLIWNLSEGNQTYTSIFESLSTGLIILDENWKVQKANKASQRLVSFSTRLMEIMEKEDAPFLDELVLNSEISDFLKSCRIENRTNVTQEFSQVAGDNTSFVMIKVLPLVKKNSEGKNKGTISVEGVIIQIEDNTDFRKKEILLHRMESLDSLTKLAASVAHEIKNPLGAIGIHIQLLQKVIKKARAGDNQLPQEKFLEDYLDVINSEISSLNSIVMDFLYAVRPVHSNLVLGNPDKIIENFMTFFEPEMNSKNVKLVLELNNESQKVLIDEKLFRQCLLNLCQNALAAIVPYGQEKSGDGMICIKSMIKNENYHLLISDNGCGMDDEMASKIFEPYYTTKADGTGLGLTMVYKIVKDFNGEITVHSRKGEGTCFTISIPVPQKKTLLLTSGENEGASE